MHTLHCLFGAPEDVAADHTLTRAPYKLLLSWIQCAEAMLRRLLLIEASVFPKPNTRPLLHPKRKRAGKLMHFHADKPEAWRVSFRCLGSPTLRQPRIKSGGDAGGNADGPVSVSLSLSKAKRPEAKRFFSAWPLAERYEALIRVFNNPESFARRLARKLHALTHRIRELFRAPPEAQHRVDDWDVFDLTATRAWPISDSS